MTSKLMIQVSRQQLEYWMVMLRHGLPETVSSMIQTVLEAKEAPRQSRVATGQWRIPVNGDWFYGTKAACERERAEYESTFTDLDREEAGVVLPEQIYVDSLSPDHSGGGAGVVDERAEFVKWVRREWPQAPLSNVRDLLLKDDPRYGEYCDPTLQRAWVGWQARAALDKVKELNQ